MAEIRLEYPELQEKIKKSIEKSKTKSKTNDNDPSLPKEFEAAILTCLTKMTDDEPAERQMDTYRLWDEQVHTMDQLPIGDNYIIIQDVVLYIIQKTIEKGFMAYLINGKFGVAPTPEDLLKFGNAFIQAIKSLNGCDICLAYKALNNLSSIYKAVSIEKIKTWFPGNNDSDGLHNCDMANLDMHNCCDFFNFEDSLCTIRGEDVKKAVDSLEGKDIIVPVREKDAYRFKI